MKRYFCWVLALSLLTPASPVFGSTKTQSLGGLCSFILSGDGAKLKPVASSSRAKRLQTYLGSLNDKEKAELISLLKAIDFDRVNLMMTKGEGINEVKQMVEGNPALGAVFIDLIEFGNQFSGIYALEDASLRVDQILEVIATDEGKIKGNVGSDLLLSQSLGHRLNMTVNATLVNLIQQMDFERNGRNFDRSTLGNIWYKFKLFIFPAYSKVRELISTSQEYQKQLNRVRLVDRVVIDQGLADARSLELSTEELAQLTYLVLNSPDEIKTVEKDLRKIFGKTFGIGKPVAIGDFEVFDAANKADEIDYGFLWESFDTANIDGLDSLTKVLSTARVRKGQGPRTIKDYHAHEIELRYEAGQRRLSYYHEQYRNWTDQDADESYTVERRHTRQVPDGTDSKGKPKTRTEVYYTSDRVTPTFENILSNSFDRGDRMVTGLSGIVDRAAQMVAKETPARKLLGAVADYSDLMDEKYGKAVSSGRGTKGLGETGESLLAQVNEMIDWQKTYATSTPRQIKATYDSDIVENFRGRNTWILTRLQNARAYLEMAIEGNRRRLPTLIPVYELMTFDHWLYGMRVQRRNNFIIKGVMATTVAAATAYGVSPEVQQFVEAYTGVSHLQIMQMLHLLPQR